MIRRVLVVVPLVSLFGCSAVRESAEFTVEPGRYSDSIAAAREVLRDYRFTIDRVDAASGVVTTAPKPTSGLATPWDPEQSSAQDEFEDLINRQQRRVRVTFAPAEIPPATGVPTPVPSVDLRQSAGSLRASVEVVVERVQRPDWRPVPKAVRSSTIAVDPEKVRRQIAPTSAVPVRTDPDLAREIAGKILSRLDSARAE